MTALPAAPAQGAHIRRTGRPRGRQRHYDCYTETAKAVAFVLGGQALVAKFSRRIHETAARLLAENDQKGD